MQDSVLNLCRVKLRDQQRLVNGPLDEYPNEDVGDTVPRSGNAVRWRPAGQRTAVQAGRAQRLHLRHHPAAGVGTAR